MDSSLPLSQIRSVVKVDDRAMVVVAQRSSIDRVPLIELFRGMRSSSFFFPPEKNLVHYIIFVIN